jgi:DNA helicase TIP49 (TBP-interacting protein)
LTIDKPIVEFMAKATVEQIDAKDIVRIQRMTGQIDHIVISFTDKDAMDYILKFKPLDEQGLEEWMFNEGYLSSVREADPAVVQDITASEKAAKFHRKTNKKSVTLTIDKPIIEYLSRIYGDQVHSDDIVRIQKLCGQIDHITVAFRDEDAVDYVLRFKCLDKRGLESWMFNSGYLVSEPEPEAAPIEPWMLDPKYLE